MSLSREELFNWVENHIVLGEGLDILKNDCEIIEFALDHCEIDIPAQNRFFINVNYADIPRFVTKKRMESLGELVTLRLREGIEALAYTGACDYSHTPRSGKV